MEAIEAMQVTLIDTYLFVAASAPIANTAMCSLFGAGFSLFATQMYNQLTPRWASTLLGFITLIMTHRRNSHSERPATNGHPQNVSTSNKS